MLTVFEAPGEYDAGTLLRRCARCGEMKTVGEFLFKNKVRGTRVSYCDPCRQAYGREHYELNRHSYLVRAREWKKRERPRIRTLINDYLRLHPCVDCGCTDLTALDFDHRDRSEKRLDVSRLARSWTWPEVLKEIQKCDVRCANCHRLRTAAQFRWTKVLGVTKTGDGWRPGSSGRYGTIEMPVQGELFVASADGLMQCSACARLWRYV